MAQAEVTVIGITAHRHDRALIAAMSVHSQAPLSASGGLSSAC
jgi:hypothetical protein